MKKYQNVEFKRRFSIELLDLFFEEFLRKGEEEKI